MRSIPRQQYTRLSTHLEYNDVNGAIKFFSQLNKIVSDKKEG